MAFANKWLNGTTVVVGDVKRHHAEQDIKGISLMPTSELGCKNTSFLQHSIDKANIKDKKKKSMQI